MSLEKLSPAGEKNSAAFNGLLNAKTSPELKISSGKISEAVQPLLAQLKRIGNDDTSTPDDISTALVGISQAISRLPEVPKNLEKLYKNTVFQFVFPIMGALYV